MPANTETLFPLTGVVGVAKLATANTSKSDPGSGTIADLVVAGANGTNIWKIKVKAEGTTTAGMVRIFVHDGSTWELFSEFEVAANTPSATNPTWEDEYIFDAPFVLPSGYKLGATTEKSEVFNVFALGGHY